MHIDLVLLDSTFAQGSDSIKTDIEIGYAGFEIPSLLVGYGMDDNEKGLRAIYGEWKGRILI